MEPESCLCFDYLDDYQIVSQFKCLMIGLVVNTLLDWAFENLIKGTTCCRVVIKWRFVSRVEPQMKAFMKGVNALIPQNLLQIFDENELEVWIPLDPDDTV